MASWPQLRLVAANTNRKQAETHHHSNAGSYTVTESLAIDMVYTAGTRLLALPYLSSLTWLMQNQKSTRPSSNSAESTDAADSVFYITACCSVRATSKKCSPQATDSCPRHTMQRLRQGAIQSTAQSPPRGFNTVAACHPGYPMRLWA